MEHDTSSQQSRRSQKKQAKAALKQQEQRKALLNKFLMVGIVVSVIAGIFLLVSSSRIPVPINAQDKPITEAAETDWIKGSATASAVLIEYSDFQCPACKAYTPLLDQLVDELGSDLAVVYRHFPLSSIHLQAELAAQAAHAAGNQDKFWEMHDLLFENQELWSQNPRAKQLMTEYASSLSLDMDQFETDFTSKETKGWVKGDTLDGFKHGINSTPTFFLNGQKLDNPNSYEEFSQLITQSLDTASPSAQPSSDE